MKRTVLTFGLISGAIFAVSFAITAPLWRSGRLGMDNGEVVGYTTMVLAFVMVFVGIRSYRENVGGGVISFGRALTVGILITLVSSVIYVASWEVVYYNFFPDFGDKYAAHLTAKMRAKGATPEAIAAKQKEMAKFREMYRNPVINSALTFVEVFPVGLVLTLVSAAILRRRARPGSRAAAAAAA